MQVHIDQFSLVIATKSIIPAFYNSYFCGFECFYRSCCSEKRVFGKLNCNLYSKRLLVRISYLVTV